MSEHARRAPGGPTLAAGYGFYGGSEGSVDEHYNSAFITCLYIADRYGESDAAAALRAGAQLGGDVAARRRPVLHHRARRAADVLRTDQAHLPRRRRLRSPLRHRLVFR